METCWCLFLLATLAVAATEPATWSAREVDAAMERARESLETRTYAEAHSARMRRDIAETGPAGGGCPYASLRHQRSRRATREAVELARVAQLFEETTRELLRSSSGDSWSDDALARLEATDLSSTALSGFCPLTNVTCNSSQEIPRSRREPTRTVSVPHAWPADGSPLPNARRISFTVHPNVSNPATTITHMVMQLGQFIDHDFALAPLMPDPGEIVDLGNPNNVIDCCSPGRRNASNCFSFDIPSDDPFYARFNQTCMNLPRSAPCTRCTLGQRQQQDILTFLHRHVLKSTGVRRRTR
ncbi:hypothetical protein MTO96_047715 [Rhipicephalus appendiculatus]